MENIESMYNHLCVDYFDDIQSEFQINIQKQREARDGAKILINSKIDDLMWFLAKSSTIKVNSMRIFINQKLEF